MQDFPEVGGVIPPGRGRQHMILPNFPKLPEIERIWTQRGAASPKFYFVDPPLGGVVTAWSRYSN